MSAHERELAIIVVNPNSTVAVTAGMDRVLESLRRSARPPIRCVTLAEGPPGIELDEHIREVVAPLIRLVERMDDEAAAFINACFSDPGLSRLRQATRKPVLGIGECAYRRAAKNNRRFGVISILEAVIARHRRYIEELGLDDFLAGDRAIGLGVTALGDDAEATFAGLVRIGEQLRDDDNAEAIVLGCAGMTPHREELQIILGVPVIDPVVTAVEMALREISAVTYGDERRN